MKRKMLVASLMLMFLLPAMALAAGSAQLTADKSIAGENELIVPIEIKNDMDLTALDIPLKFTEGAYLEEVTFTDRVESFEFQHAIIDNEAHTVIIGLVSMVAKEAPDLAPGEGAVANLHFKLDASVETVELTPFTVEYPNHSLTFYYNEYVDGRPEVMTVEPEVKTAEIAYSQGNGAVPTVYALKQNTPNPFNPSTRVAYSLPDASHVRLAIFNVLGQHVVDLVNGNQEAGEYEIVWDGKDKVGSQVASGVYFYKISAGNFSETKKMMLLK
jgi:hypothetical protein